jgi:hypothetical protein
MCTPNATCPSVLRRLDRLEGQNRWLKRMTAGALVLSGMAALMPAQGQVRGTVAEPREFILRDSKGDERAGLALTKDGPVLRFLGENGKERLWLGVRKETPGLVLCDESGKRRAALSTAKGFVSLVFYDDRERRRAWLTLGNDGPALHGLGKAREHGGLSVELDGVSVWYHGAQGTVQSGPSALKQGAGPALHGEFVEPLPPDSP